MYWSVLLCNIVYHSAVYCNVQYCNIVNTEVYCYLECEHEAMSQGNLTIHHCLQADTMSSIMLSHTCEIITIKSASLFSYKILVSILIRKIKVDPAHYSTM